MYRTVFCFGHENTHYTHVSATAPNIGGACRGDDGACHVLLREGPHLSRGRAVDAHVLVDGDVRGEHGDLLHQRPRHREPRAVGPRDRGTVARDPDFFCETAAVFYYLSLRL